MHSNRGPRPVSLLMQIETRYAVGKHRILSFTKRAAKYWHNLWAQYKNDKEFKNEQII